MFKEQMNKFKKLLFLNKEKSNENDIEEQPAKRKIETLIVFLIILVITLIGINIILKDDDVDTKKEEQSSYKVLADSQKSDNSYTDNLEEKLEKILGTMEGVRRCKCFNYIYTVQRSCSYV